MKLARATRVKLAAAGVCLIVWLALPLLACGPLEYHTVHFHLGRPDFLRMPQPWRDWPDEQRALPPREWGNGDEDEGGVPPPDSSAVLAKLKARARGLEAEGKFPEAAAAWRAWQRRLELAKAENDWSLGARQPEEASLAERLKALATWRGAGDTPTLHTYLRARDLVDDGQGGAAVALLPSLKAEPLRTHAEYLRAAIQFHSGDRNVAAASFGRLAARQPRFAAARYMVARCNYSGVVQEELERGESELDLPPYTGSAAKRLRTAAAEYDACAALEPDGDLAQSAIGMAGACLFRVGDYSGALLRYCRQLARLKPGEDRFDAWLSARLCLRRMSLAEHQRFQRLAVAAPEALPYLDLHLYHGPTGSGAAYRLGQFALELLKRRPAAAVSGRVLAHLALVEMRVGSPPRAERLARAAVARLGAGAYRDQARWQLARILERQGKRTEALGEYASLARGAALPKMRRGAHEAAAVVAEGVGDYPAALMHYFAIGYRLDYAYLLDGLADPVDLETFLRRHPHHPQAKLVRYSLAFRHLRAGRYREAERLFSSLGEWLQTAEKLYLRRTSKEQPVWPPLRTTRFLLACEREEAAAASPQAKAAAAYRAASHIFHQRHLVFYNGPLWLGERTLAFDWIGGPSSLDRSRKEVASAEKAKLDRYQEEHAALWQALRRFERIAREYPRTPQAPKALYTAALCYTFLPALERYWSDRPVHYEGKAIALYHKLQRQYPNDPLARAAQRFGGSPSEQERSQ